MQDLNKIDKKIMQHGIESIKPDISERNLPSWYLMGIFSDKIREYLPELSMIVVPSINTDFLPDMAGYMTPVPYSVSSAVRFLNKVSHMALNRRCFNRLNEHLDDNYVSCLESAQSVFQDYQLLNTVFGYNQNNIKFILENKAFRYDYLLLSAFIITMIENEDYFSRNRNNGDMQIVMDEFVKLSCPDSIKVYIYKLLCDSELFRNEAYTLYGRLYHEDTVRHLLEGVNREDLTSICELFTLFEAVGIFRKENVSFCLI